MTDEFAADLARVEKALDARGPGRMVPDRERITALLDLLGTPQRSYPSVHLTGTNGKTSTARMIDALLRAFGLRVGRYTSPHLESITERIALDGEPLSAEAFVAAYDDVAPYAELLDARSPEPLTYFELTTAIAFAAFAEAPVDAAVVEVGLGGTWDATNVLDAPVAVVTPIDLDHTQLLGDTVAEIATEKAGIIHAGATLIAAVQPPEAAEPLIRRAAEVGATVAREGLEFGVISRDVAVGGQMLTLQSLGGVYEEVFLPLHGAHQAQNAAVALAAVEAFLGAGPERPVDIEAVREGFAQVTSPGRLERVRSSPAVLLDAAHNPAGIRALTEALTEDFAFGRLVAVLAVLDDKDARTMLEILEPVVDAVVVTRNSSPRSMDPDVLAALAVEVLGTDRVDVAPRFDDAIEAAVQLAEEGTDGPLGGEGVIVTGSVVTVADARRLLRR
ncbi:MAG TPA: folylpolyglutamate synthase/dihydrofolate synthase family protein [Mycobacteriales bacterium]|nr:FolC bifunctional protein [Mycobacterium sp.]